jgi:hypothetical protein
LYYPREIETPLLLTGRAVDQVWTFRERTGRLIDYSWLSEGLCVSFDPWNDYCCDLNDTNWSLGVELLFVFREVGYDLLNITVELHLSGLIRTGSHQDMQNIRIIGFFFENRLH